MFLAAGSLSKTAAISFLSRLNNLYSLPGRKIINLSPCSHRDERSSFRGPTLFGYSLPLSRKAVVFGLLGFNVTTVKAYYPSAFPLPGALQHLSPRPLPAAAVSLCTAVSSAYSSRSSRLPSVRAVATIIEALFPPCQRVTGLRVTGL